MKEKLKSENVLFLTIFILLTLFIFVFLLLIFRESKNVKYLTEYTVEQKLLSLLEAHENGNLKETYNNEKDIIGFGLYEPSGETIVALGSAESMYIKKKISIPFSYNKAKKTIKLVRPCTMFHNKNNFLKMEMRHRMMMGNRPIGFIEIEIKDYFNKSNFYFFISFFVPFISLFFILILIFLYKKNIDYKNKLKKQEELAKLGEISRTLSHEMKNPLSAIKIQTGYLKKILPKQNEDEINIIEQEIERLNILANKISEFLKNPAGNPEKIEIINFIKDLIKKFDKPIEFENNTNEKILIKIDRNKLRSIIENIIRNAIESSQENNNIEGLKIKISYDRNYVYILFLDRGIGLPDDYKNKIFDPFYTTKINGYGLGLSLSKKFIDAVNGKIIISPKKEGGTEVKIIFKREI
ncbi:MAG: HAMP domain-containing histidine kinase [Spirochaetes bacterium]|nr:HAMP domain-containing histidine kinase [Spirochaetota bacterium]